MIQDDESPKQPPSVTPLTPPTLQLLKLCHPDRWQNQPATTLAHELTVTINKLRERGQV